MRLNKIKVSTDYITVGFICLIILICKDNKYIIALLCMIFHELGHLIVMMKYGIDRIEVKVNLFDIAITDRYRGARPYSQDIAVICAGPVVNYIMFIVFGYANIMTGHEVMYNISVISGLLCVFNLLPIESTDGGQLLAIVLSDKFNPRSVRTIMTVLTVILIIPMSCLGFCVLLESRYNYTLLASMIYFCIAVLMNR